MLRPACQIVTLTALLGLGLAPRSAAAFPAGGVFAGPVRSTGYSLYWNPAAVASKSETWQLLVDTTLSLIGLDYARTGIDPNTGQSYAEVSFVAPGPDLAFTLTSPGIFQHLRFTGGGFSPFALAANWPKHGAQRFHGSRTMIVTYALVAGPVVQLNDDWGFALTAGPMYGYLTMDTSIDFGAYVNGNLPPGSQPLPLEDPLLEGKESARAQGLTTMTSLGAWGRPAPWLRLGIGVMIPRGLILYGTASVRASDRLQEVVPGLNLKPKGDLELHYPMPWQVSAETEADVGDFAVAVLFQYSRKRIQRAIIFTISEATPDFIEGRQISVKNAHDDWLVGARLTRQFTDTLTLAARFDFMPRYVPNETVSPINLDYTQIHFSIGALWRYSEHVNFTFGYAYVWLKSFTVRNSVYNPYAPPDSGLALPSANGTYGGYAHAISIGFEGYWEPTPTASATRVESEPRQVPTVDGFPAPDPWSRPADKASP
jgi:long-subunit fatty acid transport protein